MQSHSEADRAAILAAARNALCEAVQQDRPLRNAPRGGVFDEHGGVFVTLHTDGKLRGCIGIAEGDEPVGALLAYCAAGAALRDPRFDPVCEEELAATRIEVSLLSVLTPIAADQVVPGLHGLLIERGARRGLLLPQVAVEHRLTRERFLEETCVKAGLNRDSWQDPSTRLYGFTCEVFGEPE